MKTEKIYFFVITIIFNIISLVHSQGLNYRSLYTSSVGCQLGRLQSPINLQESESSFNSTINLLNVEFQEIPNAQLQWSANERILQLIPNLAIPAGYANLEKGSVVKQYAFDRIEINTPSEHSIENTFADVEVKLIFNKVLPFKSTVNQYRKIPDAAQSLVIVLLYSTSAKQTDNGFLNDLWTSHPSQANGVAFKLDFNSYNLIENKKIFFYEGSHTSEPCDEVANYIVLNDMFYVSDPALNAIKNIFSTKYTTPLISKPIAPLYGRVVSRNFMNYFESADASFTKLTLLSYGLVLLALLM